MGCQQSFSFEIAVTILMECGRHPPQERSDRILKAPGNNYKEQTYLKSRGGFLQSDSLGCEA